MAFGFGRIITQCDHRAKVFGMGKDEIIRKLREGGAGIPVKFLRDYTVPELYGLMRAVGAGHSHPILTEWRRRHVVNPSPEPPKAEQLKLF